MVETVWNGFLRLSLVSCPIRLLSATSDARRIQLEQLSVRTGNPVTRQFVDGKTGDVVGADALVSGYEYEPSRYVAISDDELRQLGGGGANIIELEHFVPRDQIDPMYIETAYYVHPEGQLASDTVHALRLAMRHSGRVALGHVWIGERERPVLIEPHRGGLMVSSLRSEDELVAAEFSERPDGEIPAEMIEIAETIIVRRSSDFSPGLLGDRYQQGLRALIAEKARSAPPPAIPEPPPPPVVEAPPAPEPLLELPPEPPPPEPPPPEPTPPEPPSAAMATEVIEVQPEPAQPGPPPPEPEPAPPLEPPPPTSVARPEPPTVAAPPEPEPEPEAPPPTGPHDVGAEILLHIMGLGDRRYVEPGWAGNPGSRRQIEALSIRPGEDLASSAVEFRVFAQEGRATAWVSNGNYAGTRGRDLPLTGFAVRAAGEFGERLEITYEGAFFEGGVVGPKRNGELCISPVADDPLEAIRVTIVERAAD